MQMDFTNTGQLLDGTNYEVWSCRMEITLRAAGIDVWKFVTTGYTVPNKVKTMTQKDSKKNNSKAKNHWVQKERVLKTLQQYQ